MILPKILKELNIESRETFETLALGDSLGPLDVRRSGEADAVLTEINRAVYLDKALTIAVTEGLTIKNAVFAVPVVLKLQGESPDKGIEIDHCIFLDSFSIVGSAKAQIKGISLFHTNLKHLSLSGSHSGQLILSGCRVFYASIHGAVSGAFEAEGNYFSHFEIEDCVFDRVVFDHRQVEMGSLARRTNLLSREIEYKGYETLTADLNLFEFMPYKTFEDLRQDEARNSALSTIEFLKTKTDLAGDRSGLMHYLYYEVLLSQKKWHHRAFIWLVGGFLMPHRFLELALATLLVFALLFTLPGMSFTSIEHSGLAPLRLDQALYFSGITFTTIGFGDIAPQGAARLLTILEGLMGISIMSGFLVALVKKYLD